VDLNHKELNEKLASLESRISKSISIDLLENKFAYACDLIEKAIKA